MGRHAGPAPSSNTTGQPDPALKALRSSQVQFDTASAGLMGIRARLDLHTAAVLVVMHHRCPMLLPQNMDPFALPTNLIRTLWSAELLWLTSHIRKHETALRRQLHQQQPLNGLSMRGRHIMIELHCALDDEPSAVQNTLYARARDALMTFLLAQPDVGITGPGMPASQAPLLFPVGPAMSDSRLRRSA